MRRIMARVAIAVLIASLLIPAANILADQVYHTERLKLHVETSGYPLRNGQVTNIQMNGPTVWGIEEWILNGAQPKTTFHLAREFQEMLLGVFPAGTPVYTGFDLQTDARGNGNVHITITPAQVAPVLDYGQTALHPRVVCIVGGTIEDGIIIGGTLAYASDYTEVQLHQFK